jgi:hypothetical protein
MPTYAQHITGMVFFSDAHILVIQYIKNSNDFYAAHEVVLFAHLNIF